MDMENVKNKNEKREKYRAQRLERFSHILEMIRIQEGKKNFRLSTDLGFHGSTLGKIADGETKGISDDVLHKMAKAFHINRTWIETGIGEKFLAPHERVEELTEKPVAYDPGSMNGSSLIRTMQRALDVAHDRITVLEVENLEQQDRLKKLDQDEKAAENSA